MSQGHSAVGRQLVRLGLQSAGRLYYNLSFDELFSHETDPRLGDHERGRVSSLDAVAVDTGRFTGRSARDKYVVLDESTRGSVWWADGTVQGSDNRPINQETWTHLKELSAGQLNGKDLYVMDGFCGANPDTRLNVRLVTEVAWMAHFFKNMFIRPTPEELKDFKPDWTILNACKATAKDFAAWGLRSEVFLAFNIAQRMTVIGGTWYGGEMKKGIFSIMNYFLPLKGIGSFHCSANMGKNKDTALFFGLSGTGKTTLSTDPKRALIGDDEHGWDQSGIFNFEGGCYAKCIGLTPQREPQVYAAIRRNALLENVEMDDFGNIDFASDRKTENTRVSYPIEHIDNIVRPRSKGRPPSKIIFLACDAYGVLPPVAKLSGEQAMYHFLSGYTAKIAGTEHGIKHPQATFSACFGKAFLMLHPTAYAGILAQKMQEHHTAAYLINTGWVAGPYGTGHRIPLKDNRLIVDAILDGSIEEGDFDLLPVFDLHIPRHINGVDDKTLNPRHLWADKSAYDASLRKLGEMFVENFKSFTDTPLGKRLAGAGPRL
ncbi:MAG: phosphoenolpyruvate carboxykinase (ATP) [Candidatus Omnitrophica bacterium]|nr:phosphoenolpyruvate carboxykinase (ATP) [Candidatus Omnitrophota bacterium]